MSFQDLEAGNGARGAPRRNGRPAGPGAGASQAVASGVFQINTAVATFQRLVNTLGTPKDTPDLREKIHKTRTNITQLVKDTSEKLKQARQIIVLKSARYLQEELILLHLYSEEEGGNDAIVCCSASGPGVVPLPPGLRWCWLRPPAHLCGGRLWLAWPLPFDFFNSPCLTAV